jgi:hypothetical protein
VGFIWRFADANAYWQFLIGAAGAIAMVVNALEEDERERVRLEVVKRVTPFEGAHGFELPGESLVASAT